ncbi:MAG: Trk system potassium transporter TrkA [Clostridia bacterium]|nr:Trk system potassium transporter TrkA [Clostridia bacterium]MBR1685954.1 Trk system potassium transporter TrkA [Clostridia bacterium]
MRIMVVGAGKVGRTLAEHLTREGHDVVVIDNDQEVLDKCQDDLDVMCVLGNGANMQTLVNAAVDETDIVIAATASDEINLICVLAAKRLGAKYTIARVRDPQYQESLRMFQTVMEIDSAINPELATALEIGHLLRFPFAANVEVFAKGKIEMIAFKVHPQDAIVGQSLRNISASKKIPRVLYCAIQHDQKVFIPNGNSVIEAGDHVYVTGEHNAIKDYFKYLRGTMRLKNVMIIGGGRISYYLTQRILMDGMHVKLIELDPKKAAVLSDSLPHADVLCGDGTSIEMLEQEDLRRMDAFICLTDRDEENLMAGLYASRIGVPKVIIKNNRTNYSDIIASLGLDSVVSPKQITSDYILRYTRAIANSHGSSVEKLYRLLDGQAEALEFIVKGDESFLGKPLRDLTMRENTLVAVIVRGDKIITPFGNDHLEAGDSVIIMARKSGISRLNEVILK